jgi:ATP-dependent DNA helicase RecQ
MALTATATALTREEIIQRLALTDAQTLVSNFDRPNIRYQVQAKTDANKQLEQFLTRHRNEAGIIYCLSRKKTESTAERLNRQGFTALPYHAGLESDVRAENQRRFLNEDGLIIVATIAFGMGIDKPDVRFVAHLDLPKSLEAYYQETGRAGRDGLPAEAWMIYGLQDVVRIRQMADESVASEEYKRHERQKLDTLLGWCEITACRRSPLLTYFGEPSIDSCGNCDNCQQPPLTRDGSKDAQKLLSAVYRSNQTFGAAHIVDILLGKLTPKVKQHSHNDLSVFGIGADKPQQTWRSVIRQLVVHGCLRADADRYGALVLTESARAILRGEESIEIRIDADTPKKLRVSGSGSGKVRSTATDADIDTADLPMWEALRECRQRLASEHGVPPYVVFHDSTLKQMLTNRPLDLDDMLSISGVGQSKLDRYGEEFLAVLSGVG